MSVRMRPATAHDAERLLAWRNDPVTQVCSRSTAPVSREDHDRWMQFNVLNGYPQHLVMMADNEYGSVGVVRFDSIRSDVMAFDVSITVAPQHRGKGLALDALREACSYMEDFTLNAEVRRENIASRRVFENCGFEQVSPNDEFVRYRRHPLT